MTVSYPDPYPWYEQQPHRTTTKPPAPILHEEERPAPRLIYGPRGEVIATVGPSRVPFGPRPSQRPEA